MVWGLYGMMKYLTNRDCVELTREYDPDINYLSVVEFLVDLGRGDEE
mgnify:CR=1 FL=1|jgi:hypothetical protein